MVAGWFEPCEQYGRAGACMALYPPQENGCHTCVFLDHDPPCKHLGRQIRTLFREVHLSDHEHDEYEETPVVLGLSDDELEGSVGGAGWRVAKSLVILAREIDATYPKRSKRNDGTIGDAAHARRPSRHNPNTKGVVCARDFTHDPPYFDVHKLARELVRHPHPDLAYIVSNHQIATRANGFKWRRYGGASGHTEHAHIAVGVGADAEPRPPYDSTAAWGIGTPLPQKDRLLKITSPLLRGNDVLWVQQQVNKLKTYPQGVTPHLNEDGIYGPETARCVEVFQYRYKLEPTDGIVGPKTWKALRKETGND